MNSVVVTAGEPTPARVLGPDGSVPEGYRSPLPGEDLLAAFRLMLLSRRIDERAFNLQRQGRLGTFSPVEGQEASVVGSAWALDPARDWVVPQYRELPAMLRQGHTLERFLLYVKGNPEGNRIADGVNVLPIQISLATQIPHAVGLAWGLRHQGLGGVVCVYFGDGASSEGDFHEACNLAGVRGAPVIFFLQNNGWAISTPVSMQTAAASFASRAAGYGVAGELVDGNDFFAVYEATAHAVERARAGLGPTLIESRTYRMGPHNTADDPTRYRDPEELEAQRALDPIARLRTYLELSGVLDPGAEERMKAEIDDEVEAAVAAAEAREGAGADQLFDHVYADPPARVREQWHALAGEDGAGAPEQRRVLADESIRASAKPDEAGSGLAASRPVTAMNMVEAIRTTLAAEMERDERIILLGQDIGHNGGMFRATEGLQERFGEDRVVDMPLAEGVIVGSAVGLACSGLRPIPEIQFLGFASQAFHQIEGQVARMRFRSQGRYPMPIVIRAPFGGNVRTPELHSDAHEAKYANSPGLKVVMPSTAHDAKGLLMQAIRGEDPVLFCEPLRGYRLIKDDVPVGDYAIPFGRLRIVREGTDITLVAWSAAVVVAEQAAELAAKEGISCQIVDLRTLVPLDAEGLGEAVAATGRAVVVHEAPLTAGFGAEVVATIVEQAFWSLTAPIARVAAPDTPYPIASVEQLYVPSTERVLGAIRRVIEAA